MHYSKSYCRVDHKDANSSFIVVSSIGWLMVGKVEIGSSLSSVLSIGTCTLGTTCEKICESATMSCNSQAFVFTGVLVEGVDEPEEEEPSPPADLETEVSCPQVV